MQEPDGYKGVHHEVGSFTPYTLNSGICVILTGLIAEQNGLQRTKMYKTGLISMGHSVLKSSHAYLLHYDLDFQGEFPAPLRAFSGGATISETTLSSPQNLFLIWRHCTNKRHIIITFEISNKTLIVLAFLVNQVFIPSL